MHRASMLRQPADGVGHGYGTDQGNAFAADPLVAESSADVRLRDRHDRRGGYRRDLSVEGRFTLSRSASVGT